MAASLRRLTEWLAATCAALIVLALASLAALTVVPTAAAAEQVTAERADTLRYMLTQDCGSCHGLTLAGGLGPSLQPQAVADKPVEYLAVSILYGRPGTAMPPWSALLSEQEVLWLARELKGLNP
jgi:cytochrome c55X